MADKRSPAARKKHAPARGEAKRDKREKKAAPESRKLGKAEAGKAEAPAAKVKRGEEGKAPKQAEKAVKGAGEEAGSEDPPECGEGGVGAGGHGLRGEHGTA